jgi:general secretion pathway protein H
VHRDEVHRARSAARRRAGSRPGGFTLLELLIVVAIIALASAVVSLSLPDPAAARLEREALRLATLLEGGRAQARAMGLEVGWTVGPGPADPARREAGSNAARADDFHFTGLPPGNDLPTRWLEPSLPGDAATQLQVELVPPRRAVQLGPEPLVAAQRIVLRLGTQRRIIATDGLAPFALQADADAAP